MARKQQANELMSKLKYPPIFFGTSFTGARTGGYG